MAMMHFERREGNRTVFLLAKKQKFSKIKSVWGFQLPVARKKKGKNRQIGIFGSNK
jgi:hypothetical protein